MRSESPTRATELGIIPILVFPRPRLGGRVRRTPQRRRRRVGCRGRTSPPGALVHRRLPVHTQPRRPQRDCPTLRHTTKKDALPGSVDPPGPPTGVGEGSVGHFCSGHGGSGGCGPLHHRLRSPPCLPPPGLRPAGCGRWCRPDSWCRRSCRQQMPDPVLLADPVEQDLTLSCSEPAAIGGPSATGSWPRTPSSLLLPAMAAPPGAVR